MRILVASHYLGGLTGSETFWLTVIEHLRRHDCEVFAHAEVWGDRTGELVDRVHGVAHNEFQLAGIKPDICLVSHTPIARRVARAFPNTARFLFVHGVLPSLEHPAADVFFDRIFCVSREVQDFVRSVVEPETPIRAAAWNPVDSERFHPDDDIRERSIDVLVVSNRMPLTQRDVIKKVCADMKLSLRFIGSCVDVCDYGAVAWSMASARIVISLGRGIIEAMMSGAVPVVFDYRGGDGIITPGNVDEFAWRNFSGRTLELETDYQNVYAHLTGAVGCPWGSLRDWAVKRYDAKRLVDDLWDIIPECL